MASPTFFNHELDDASEPFEINLKNGEEEGYSNEQFDFPNYHKERDKLMRKMINRMAYDVMHKY